MEITLTRQAETQVSVTCDGQTSHTFDLLTLVPNDEKHPPHPLEDPETYGQTIYAALFPPETPAHCALDAMTMPGRILFVTADTELDTIPWEYAHDSSDFLVFDHHFVRGLPPEQRIAPPTMENGLHIVAVPSNPLNKEVSPLNIDGEWLRLTEIIQEVPAALTLERTRPPTLEMVRRCWRSSATASYISWAMVAN